MNTGLIILNLSLCVLNIFLITVGDSLLVHYFNAFAAGGALMAAICISINDFYMRRGI